MACLRSITSGPSLKLTLAAERGQMCALLCARDAERPRDAAGHDRGDSLTLSDLLKEQTWNQ
jgi:hypothetical protein